MHRNYWSCTKFADWLRKTPKPSAETSKGWKEWKKKAQTAYPFRFWLAEEGLDKIQDFIMYPLDKIYAIKYYINNRWITHTHALTAHPKDINPGTWCDVGDRFLPCLFNELVDFVEIELAWWHLAFSGKEERKKYNAPWYNFGWFRIRGWRCAQAGLDNLQWQISLRWTEDECGQGSPNIGQPTPQAKTAQEILDLYTWWTKDRPARPDPYDASDWNNLYEKMREKYQDLVWEDKTDIEKQLIKSSLESLDNLEEKYEKEDEEMLIRLIRIRKSLWT